MSSKGSTRQRSIGRRFTATLRKSPNTGRIDRMSNGLSRSNTSRTRRLAAGERYGYFAAARSGSSIHATGDLGSHLLPIKQTCARPIGNAGGRARHDSHAMKALGRYLTDQRSLRCERACSPRELIAPSYAALESVWESEAKPSDTFRGDVAALESRSADSLVRADSGPGLPRLRDVHRRRHLLARRDPSVARAGAPARLRIRADRVGVHRGCAELGVPGCHRRIDEGDRGRSAATARTSTFQSFALCSSRCRSASPWGSTGSPGAGEHPRRPPLPARRSGHCRRPQSTLRTAR